MKYTFALLFLVGLIAFIGAAPVEEDTPDQIDVEDPENAPEEDTFSELNEDKEEPQEDEDQGKLMSDLLTNTENDSRRKHCARLPPSQCKCYHKVWGGCFHHHNRKLRLHCRYHKYYHHLCFRYKLRHHCVRLYRCHKWYNICNGYAYGKCTCGR